MTDKNVRIRLQVIDGDKVRKELDLTGKEGEAALRKIEKATKEPSAGLKALGAVSDELSGKMQGMSSGLGPLGAALSALGPHGLAAAAAIALVTAGIKASLGAIAEAEKSVLRLEGVLKANGNTFGLTARQISDYSDELERATFFTKENFNQAAAVLSTFQIQSRETFKEALSLSADLAEVFGGDVASSAKALGKALQDPTEGLSALGRMGVRFTEDQKNLIESLVESNKTLDAQNVILDAVKGKVEGTAEAVAGGLAGAWDNLGDSVGDAFEAYGEFLNSEGRITNFFNTLSELIDNQVRGWTELTRMVRAATGEMAAVKNSDLISRQAEITGRMRELDRSTAPEKSLLRQHENSERMRLQKENTDLQKELASRNEAFRQSKFDGSYGPQAQAKKVVSEDDPETPKGRTKLTAARKEDRKALQDYLNDLEQQNRLLKLGTTERKEEEGVLRARNAALQDGKMLTLDQEKQARSLIRSNEEYVKQQKDIEEQNKLLMEPFRRGIENVQDALANMLVEGEFSFRSLGSIAKKIAAEVAASWIIRPLIAPIFAGLSGGFGGSTGGGTLGSASSGLNSFSNILSIGKFAANPMGTINPILATLGLIGPTSAAALGVGAAGASALGAASSVGAAAAGAAGAGAGAAGALSLSSIAGPAALAIGAIALLSGAFGGKPSSKLQGGVIDLGTGSIDRYGLDFKGGKKFSQENADAVTGIAAAATAIADMVNAKVDQKLAVSVSNRYGYQYGFGTGGNDVTKSFATAGELLKSLTSELNSLGDAGQNVKTAIEKIDWSKTEQALTDIAFAVNLDTLGETKDSVSELVTQFRELSAQAERLGLSVEKVKTGFSGQFNKSIYEQILGLTNPQALGQLQLAAQFGENLQTALEVGGDLAQVEKLHKIQMLQLEQQTSPVLQQNLQKLQDSRQAASQLSEQFRSVSKSLRGALENMRFGGLSPLSPKEQFEAAQRRTDELIARGRLGDVNAANELNAFAPQFAELAQQYFGTNEQYAKVFANLEAGIEEVASTADRQADYQQQMLSATDRQIAAIESGFGTLTEEFRKITEIKPYNASGLDENYAGGAFSASNPNEVAIRNLSAINAAGMGGTLDMLLTQFTPGVTPGGGRRSAFFESNPFYAQLFRTAAKSAGIPGFELGGITPINTPFMVGERGPEIMTLNTSARVTPISAANDNSLLQAIGVLTQEVRGLSHLMQSSLNVNVEGANAMVGRLTTIAQTLTDSARTQLLAQAR